MLPPTREGKRMKSHNEDRSVSLLRRRLVTVMVTL